LNVFFVLKRGRNPRDSQNKKKQVFVGRGPSVKPNETGVGKSNGGVEVGV